MSDSVPPAVAVTEVPGAGRPIAFMHGLFGQGKNFTGVAKALSNEHSSLLVDLPNHGASAWSDRVSYVEIADSIAARLREITGGAPLGIVGHSMGGKAAMVLALRHPDLVERLVVVDISPVQTDGMSQFVHLLGALAFFDLTAIESRGEADAALRASVPDDSVRGFLLQNLRYRDNHWTWLANLDVLRRDLPKIGEFPISAGDASYDGPTLWIAGGDSSYIQDSHAELMRSYFPMVRKVTIKNAGHWVHAEQPAIFIETLRRFFAGMP